MKRSTVALVLSLTAVFISGAVVGGFGYRVCTRTEAVQSVDRPQQRRPSPEVFREMFIHAMSKRLDLNDDQVNQLHVILDRTDQRFRELDRKTRPEKLAIQKMQHEEINAILTPVQQEAYAKFLEERTAERRRRGRERPEAEKKEKEKAGH